MRYFLKKDLPGIKAETEMVLSENVTQANFWHTVDFNQGAYIPPSELSDWIEEQDGIWKPKLGDVFYIPMPYTDAKRDYYPWQNEDKFSAMLFSRGFVCPTSELAIELADRMIETAKKFWEEKK